MRLHIAFFALVAAVTPVAAQTPSTVTIYSAQAAASEGIRPGATAERATAVTADGRLWALSYYYKTGTPTVRETRLWVSADGGSSWKQATKARIAQGAYGSMVAGTDGTTLHVAYQGRTNPNATYEWGIYYGAYDTVTDKWVGTADTAVIKNTGTGKYNQATAPNIAMNSRGTLLVSGIRSSGWSTWFKVNSGSGWSAETKLQGGSYSKNSCVLAGPDDCFHFCYQSGGTYTAYYRRYDPVAKAFGAEGEIQVKIGISNETTLAVGPDGDIWIGYVTSPGSSNANPGWIEVSHARIGTWKFTPYQIYKDPLTTNFTLTWGNHAFYCVELGRAGDKTRVYYTKPTGTVSAKTLARPGPVYMQEWTGSGFTKEAVAVNTPPNAQVLFLKARADRHNGVGEMLAFSLRLYNTATPPAMLSELLQLRFNPGALVPFGLGCETSAKELPLIGAASFPHIGAGGYRITLDRAIPSTAAVLFIGPSNTTLAGLPLPLDLTPFGLAGCHFRTSILITATAVADPQGHASTPLPVPNDPVLSGALLYKQWGFVDAKAAGGLRFSGGAVTIIR